MQSIYPSKIVEEEERLVSEERRDEFQVFPAVRCPGHTREDEQRRFKADMQRQRGIGLRYFVLEFWILILKAPAESGGFIYFFFFPYFLWNLSILPPLSMNLCLPVKRGWQAEQISTFRFSLVDLVLYSAPQAHLITVSL